MRRRRSIEQVAHQDRWLLSYSDFMTLLFALFVVLFASTYRDNLAIRRVSRAIHVGFQSHGASSQDPVASAADKSMAFQTNPHPDPAPGMLGVDTDKLRQELEAAMGQEIKNHEIDVRVTPEGFVISLKDLGFFNSGEAELRPGGEQKIARIGKVLAKQSLDIGIEGHSDNQPIHTDKFRSNWELSSARATTVLTFLVNDAGFDPKKVSVAGYGEYRPIADNSTPEGRLLNRRVDLVVVGTPARP
jgi:chemotaxis protein MotB